MYLLVDRTLGEDVVYSAPDDRGVYAHLDRHAFGGEVRVPEPVGVVLDTEPLKGWVR